MKLQELNSHFPAAAEYLTQILLIGRDKGFVSNTRLADRLKVSKPAVSQAIGRLKKLILVDQDRYGSIRLSVAGQKIAENVVRRHFLLEHLLVGILEYPWDKSDDEAAVLQSFLSDELTEHLDERLGRPQTCPHGNPMPGSSIEQSYMDAPMLVDAKEGSTVRIIRITEEGEMIPGMLPFCQRSGISPGKKLSIEKQEDIKTVCMDGLKRIEIPENFSVCLRWTVV